MFNQKAQRSNAADKSGVLYVRTEFGIRRFAVSVDVDTLVAADSSRFHLSDVFVLEPGVFYLSLESEALREWMTFSKSLRSVTLSALFDDAGDVSHLVKNAVFGGLLIMVFVLLFQLNGMRGEMANISAQLTQVQMQIVQPVQLQIPR